jgi:hypothetical protein
VAESSGHPGIIAVRDESDDTPTDLEMPEEIKGLKVALFCWSPDSLAWERMRQPQIAPLADDLPLDTRMEYSANDLIFKGIHATHKALTSDVNWLVWKYTWSGEDLVRIEGPLEGSWDNRGSLGWG